METKIAVITGGGRGLGRSAALHLARRGVHSVITWQSNPQAAEQTVAELQQLGVKAVALRLDVGQVGTFGDFAGALQGALERTWGRKTFDYLVNNAGVGLHRPFAETSEADFDAMLTIHLKGPYFLTQKLVPFMAEGGRILNVSTGLARFTLPGYSAYASMKGAVEVLTRYLARELAPRKITVNTVAPGAIATDFGGGAVRDNPQVGQMVASFTTLGRVGQADDIGPVVSSLLVEANGWINGQRIEASGGMFL
jgi:NAD(P)-dependent dehydrogenase (short-subunit alcohol dehydrogenase family)